MKDLDSKIKVEVLEENEKFYQVNILVKKSLGGEEYRIDGFKISKSNENFLLLHLPSWTHTKIDSISMISDLKYNDLIEHITGSFFDKYKIYDDKNIISFYDIDYYEVYKIKSFEIEGITFQALSVHYYFFEDRVEIELPDIYKYRLKNQKNIDNFKKIIERKFRSEKLEDNKNKTNYFKYLDFCLDGKAITKLEKIKYFLNLDLKKEFLDPTIKVTGGSIVGINYKWTYIEKLVSLLFDEFIYQYEDYSFDQYSNLSLEDIVNDKDYSGSKISSEDIFNIEKDDSKDNKKEFDKFGRIKNPENNPLEYYPNTELRIIGGEKRKVIINYTYNMINRGHFTYFHMDILKWIGILRYAKSSNLIQLNARGYIGESFSAKRVKSSIDTLYKCGLVNRSKAVTVDENTGNILNTAGWQILTLDRMGVNLLKSVYGNEYKIDNYALLRDYTTIRSNLSTNQWLIYWLTQYPEHVKNNYRLDRIIYKKSIEFVGAKIDAYVNIKGHELVAESVRKNDLLIDKMEIGNLRFKLERLIDLFDNLDQLYSKYESVKFEERPIIMLIFESFDHMKEIYENIKDILDNNPSQKVYFTTDIKMYNDDPDKFFVIEDNEFVPARL